MPCHHFNLSLYCSHFSLLHPLFGPLFFFCLVFILQEIKDLELLLFYEPGLVYFLAEKTWHLTITVVAEHEVTYARWETESRRLQFNLMKTCWHETGRRVDLQSDTESRCAGKRDWQSERQAAKKALERIDPLSLVCSCVRWKICLEMESFLLPRST